MILLMIGCKAKFKPKTQQEILEDKKLHNCYTKWERLDLKGVKKVKVLYFGKYFDYDLLTYPNRIIGVDENNDTIVAFDNTPCTPYVYKPGDTAYLLQTYWFDDEKGNSGIAFTTDVSKKYDYRIKKLYYARFAWGKY